MTDNVVHLTPKPTPLVRARAHDQICLAFERLDDLRKILRKFPEYADAAACLTTALDGLGDADDSLMGLAQAEVEEPSRWSPVDWGAAQDALVPPRG